MPADPLGRQGGVALPQGTEAQMVAAQTQHSMATRQLAADAVTWSDELGVEPLPQCHSPTTDALPDHTR